MTWIAEPISLLPFDWAQFQFMQHALVAVVIIAPLLAFLGCMVINNQMAFFSDAIGHAGLTGIALGALMGLADPLWAMVIFACLLSVGITLLRRYGLASSDTVIGLVMSGAVALGIVILSRGGGFARYSGFLIGDVLSITGQEIGMLALTALLFLVFWALFFNRLFLVSVNTSLARSRKIPVWVIQGVFAALTAIVVTVSIQWVGILVINALIILPAATSRNLAASTVYYFWGSGALSLVAGIAGLIASFYWSTATGATIVLFAMALYLLSLATRMLKGRSG